MIIDLSVVLNPDTPVFPGDPPMKIEKDGEMPKDPFCGHVITTGTHAGTHIDAPAHMIDGGKMLNEYPIDHFVGHGVYIPLEQGEFDLTQVKDAKLTTGDIVIFDTGFADKFNHADYFEKYPAIPEDIANYLVEKQIKMLGFDMCSPDYYPEFPIHKILLGGDVLIIENLSNVRQLAGKEFEVYALPLNLDLEAAPARVIAITS